LKWLNEQETVFSPTKVALRRIRQGCDTFRGPNSITLSWSQTGPKLVVYLPRAGIWLIIYLASSELARASRSVTSFGPVCDQLRTCLRPG